MSDNDHNDTFLVLKQFCTSGFFFGINMGSMSIEKMHSEYPKEWNEYYNKHNFAAYDPVFRWGYLNTGTKRWSEISFKLDVKKVMQKAEAYGLKYGVVITKKINGKKSILTGAREDREFTDEEISILYSSMDTLIATNPDNYFLTDGEIDALSQLATGHDYADIAVAHNKSIGAIKLRVSNARIKLSAKNTIHAIYLATKSKII